MCDAHEYLLDNFDQFDFIWSSPPCQSHSGLSRLNFYKYGQRRYPDLRLYEEIIFLRQYCEASWVVENVVPYYKPLIHGEVRGRHMFWSKRYIPEFNFSGVSVGKGASRRDYEECLGVTLPKGVEFQWIQNMVHPRLGLEIFDILASEA